MIPYGVTLFCDDIRSEEDGKRILIGVYDEGFSIPQTPAVVPQFAFLIKLVEPIEYRGKQAQIRITAPSQDGRKIIFDQEVGAERWDLIDRDDFDQEARCVESNLLIRSAPFPIDAPGYIRVRAYYGDQEVRLGSLRIIEE